ncbi:fucolectin-5-like [Nelusetta ayraudi]|uniref:fucolectin-5-like n=1 Tax=Nelusetta ayraudi TaxID=303726 RepID=UPI003F6FD9B7
MAISIQETNIAGIATQSSQSGAGSADKAIDGNHDSNVKHGSCSNTLTNLSPWWRLDLMRTYKINSVMITFPANGLKNAEIRIGNSLDHNGNINPRCAVISVATPGSTKTYVCNGMEGRYINIVVPGKRQQLILCEVEKLISHREEKRLSPVSMAV